jgi:hypothetical protein
LFEWLDHIGEEVTVRGNGKVKRISVDVAQLSKLADEIHNTSAQKRLPSGEANFFDPQRNQNPRHAEIFGKVQVAIEGAFVAGAAVDTTIVASVGDGNPQVGNAAPEFVGKRQFLAPRSSLLAFFGKRTVGGKNPAEVSFPSTGGAGVSTCTLGAFLRLLSETSACTAVKSLRTAEFTGQITHRHRSHGIPEAAGVGNSS